ncbi:MAG: DUF2281 domain-containing protein [Thermoguttaceae bacterium]
MMSTESSIKVEICEQIERLPLFARLQLVQSVLQSLAGDLSRQSLSLILAGPDTMPNEATVVPRKREFGFLKRRIEMSDDFDEPLDCMKEYMS